MARYYTPRRHEAEKRLPHTVDIPVPKYGLGDQLNRMLTWCRINLADGFWDHHNHRDKPVSGMEPKDYARFYFVTEADAERFASVWKS